MLFKPFEKIVYRYKYSEDSRWTCGLISHVAGPSLYLVGGAVMNPLSSWEVLPFEGNEDLVGSCSSAVRSAHLPYEGYAVFSDSAYELRKGRGMIEPFTGVNQATFSTAFTQYNYCIPLLDFMSAKKNSELSKHIYCVKDGKVTPFFNQSSQPKDK